MGARAAVQAQTARIGPNAIIQTLAALRERIGAPATACLLRAAGLSRYETEVPSAMVPEHDVSELYRVLRMQLDEPSADHCARRAGARTADYVLANRIPRAAQMILRLLPARFAAPALLSSIAKHTWTFAGSGTVSVAGGSSPRIAIEGCPICRGSSAHRPVCGYYAASFEGLFRSLVSRRASVVEVECQALGAKQCIFEVRW
jgi:divinyl protochlorophyllide a 8-vinyl-reductase